VETAARGQITDLLPAPQPGNGFRDAQIAYWIEGEPRASPTPRWSIVGNIFAPALEL
jgi:hypothetical protein